MGSKHIVYETGELLILTPDDFDISSFSMTINGDGDYSQIYKVLTETLLQVYLLGNTILKKISLLRNVREINQVCSPDMREFIKTVGMFKQGIILECNVYLCMGLFNNKYIEYGYISKLTYMTEGAHILKLDGIFNKYNITGTYITDISMWESHTNEYTRPRDTVMIANCILNNETDYSDKQFSTDLAYAIRVNKDLLINFDIVLTTVDKVFYKNEYINKDILLLLKSYLKPRDWLGKTNIERCPKWAVEVVKKTRDIKTCNKHIISSKNNEDTMKYIKKRKKAVVYIDDIRKKRKTKKVIIL